VFLGIGAYVAAHPELVGKIGKVFQFRLSNPDGVWTIDLKNGAGAVAQGESPAPDTTLEILEADFVDMTSGKADAQKLYFGGKLKIKGDLMASQKLNFLKDIDPAWAKEQVAKLKQGGGAAQAPAAAAAPRQGRAAQIVEALQKRLASNAGLAGEVRAVVELRVKQPDATWTLDFKGGAAVKSGPASGADATLTVSDEDLVKLCRGEATAQDLFQRGGLRVDGDVRVAQRLGFLKGLV
jgi:3-hydroxyacyl-CoA dehydrogenase/3a,7a,12a-trihydroxy-5b-cholest-24-enoyl-CoA hydratase